MGPVAIVGAGISGLSCAQALLAAGVGVRVFERRHRVGGRCSTRLWQGHLVDDGVPFFTAHTPGFKRELLTRLRQFRPIIPPVLDRDGQIVVSPGGPRFFVLQGNNYFAQVLTHGLDVRVDTPAERVEFLPDGGIDLLGENYRAVVSSLPVSDTVRLFGLSESAADFPNGISALLEYGGFDVGDAGACYAHVLPDDAEPVVASYCENHKAARIIGPKTVFVIHAGAEFSRARADEPEESFVDQLVRANDALWKIVPGKCTAAFAYRWRVRTGSAPCPPLPPAAFLCGDACAGASVEEAWHDGRRAAEEVLAFLGADLSAE